MLCLHSSKQTQLHAEQKGMQNRKEYSQFLEGESLLSQSWENNPPKWLHNHTKDVLNM